MCRGRRETWFVGIDESGPGGRRVTRSVVRRRGGSGGGPVGRGRTAVYGPTGGRRPAAWWRAGWACWPRRGRGVRAHRLQWRGGGRGGSVGRGGTAAYGPTAPGAGGRRRAIAPPAPLTLVDADDPAPAARERTRGAPHRLGDSPYVAGAGWACWPRWGRGIRAHRPSAAWRTEGWACWPRWGRGVRAHRLQWRGGSGVGLLAAAGPRRTGPPAAVAWRRAGWARWARRDRGVRAHRPGRRRTTPGGRATGRVRSRPCRRTRSRGAPVTRAALHQPIEGRLNRAYRGSVVPRRLRWW
jgi:hypothetical protein